MKLNKYDYTKFRLKGTSSPKPNLSTKSSTDPYSYMSLSNLELEIVRCKELILYRKSQNTHASRNEAAQLKEKVKLLVDSYNKRKQL